MTTASSLPSSAPRFLVVLDVDSTLIENEVIDLLASEAGAADEVAAVTAAAMRGELDFGASLARRVALLTGLPPAALDAVRRRIEVTPGVRELIDGVHARGGRIAAVSGGFHEVLDPLAGALGVNAWRANRLAIADGLLAGHTVGPVIDAAAKADALREWAQVFGVPMRRTVAIGDGANDLAMMAAAGLSIAFDAKPAVRRAADIVLAQRNLATVLACLPVAGLPASVR